MKKITVILLLIAAVSFLFLVTGCTEEDSGMSIDDRIKAFVSDLNDLNRAGIFKENFHPDSTSYVTGDAGTIEGAFAADGQDYFTTSISGSGSSRTVVIDGDQASHLDYGSYTFNMKEEDDDDWLILSISDSGGVVLP